MSSVPLCFSFRTSFSTRFRYFGKVSPRTACLFSQWKGLKHRGTEFTEDATAEYSVPSVPLCFSFRTSFGNRFRYFRKVSAACLFSGWRVETQRHRVHRGRHTGILRVLCASVFFYPYGIWHPLSVFHPCLPIEPTGNLYSQE